MSYPCAEIPDSAHFEPKSAKSSHFEQIFKILICDLKDMRKGAKNKKSPNTKMYQGRNVYFSSAYTKRFCGWGLFVYDDLLAIENI